MKKSRNLILKSIKEQKFKQIKPKNNKKSRNLIKKQKNKKVLM